MSLTTKFSKRQITYGVIIGVILVAYVFRFISFGEVVIPTRGRIDGEYQRIKKLRAQLNNLNKAAGKNKEARERIADLTSSYWRKNGKSLTNQIQLKIERIGRKAGLTLKKVGAPKVSELSDNVEAIDVTVSSSASIKELSRFLEEIDKHEPKLVWYTCVVRPNRTKNPTAVNISGRLRAYVLGKSASQLLGEGNL